MHTLALQFGDLQERKLRGFAEPISSERNKQINK
jgi:hypothetical protein